MAMKKVRDDDGSSTCATRAHSMHIALSFCHSVKAAIKTQDASDVRQFSKMAKREGRKYSLKVVKLATGSERVAKPTGQIVQGSTVRKEKELFRAAMGKQAKFATQKDRVHEAMREVEHQQLAKKAGQIAAKVKARMAREEKKAQT